MPKPGLAKKFVNFKNTLKTHFCLYCDTECLLEPIDIVVENPNWGGMRKLSKHIPIAASAYLDVSEEMTQAMADNNAPGRNFFSDNKLVIFKGRDCMTRLMEHIYNAAATVKGEGKQFLIIVLFKRLCF